MLLQKDSTSTILMICLLGLGFCFSTANADTEVRGFISQDTLWTVDQSPYLATGSLIVKEGVTLTIQPGVTVKFNSNTALQVDGGLIARGTEALPITFTAAEGKNSGSWGYILFTETSIPSELDGAENYVRGGVLEHAIIEFAGGISDIGAALKSDTSNLLIDRCMIDSSATAGIWANTGEAIIRDSTIKNNENHGVVVSSTSRVTITGNLITGNSVSSTLTDFRHGGGIWVEGSATITNNTISENTTPLHGGGIYIGRSFSTTSEGIISDNTITENNATGFGGGVYTRRATVTIANNTIKRNACPSFAANRTRGIGGGIALLASTATIMDNTLSENSAATLGGGMYFAGSSGSITNNAITENVSPQASALFLANIGDFSVLGNIIVGNRASGTSDTHTVYVTGSPTSQFRNNAIYGNQADFDIFYDVSKGTNMDATNNYWGTADEAKISNRIYDFFTDAGKGIINFVPFLTTPPGAPLPPTSLAITASDATTTRLAWNPNSEPGIAGYKVYYDTDSGLPYEGQGANEGNSPIDVGNVTSFSVSGLQPANTYFFVVTAYYDDGTEKRESGFSNEVRSNSPPSAPVNLAPAAGAKDVPLMPTLESSPFSDPDATDSHKASQWQVTTTPSDYTTPVFDSGVDTTNLIRIALTEGTLNDGTTYYWRVRYQDNPNSWSEYSAETHFDTRSPLDIVTGQFALSLGKGLNMISLPVRPDTPFTAQTLLDRLGATVLTKLDVARQKFVPYLPGISNDFSIEGGQGYIINVTEAKTVTFTGTVWDNVNAAPDLSPDPSPKPVLERSEGRRGEFGPVWAFAIGGQLSHGLSIFSGTVTVRHQKAGWSVTGQIERDHYAVAFANLNQKAIVKVGDVLEISINDIEGQIHYTITAEDLLRAFTRVHINPQDLLPDQTILLQNYPNPFNPETWIPYQLAEPADVTISIYDVQGVLVRQLNLGHQIPGHYHTRHHAAYWDGRNVTGERVSSGLYFYQFRAEDYTAIRRMVISK